MKYIKLTLTCILFSFIYNANIQAQVELYEYILEGENSLADYYAFQVDFSHNRFVYRAYYDFGSRSANYVEFCGIIKPDSYSKIFIKNTIIVNYNGKYFSDANFRMPENIFSLNLDSISQGKICITNNIDILEMENLLSKPFEEAPFGLLACMKKTKKNKLDYKRFPRELRKRIKERERIINDNRYFEMISCEK